jgi:hypothetical protein
VIPAALHVGSLFSLSASPFFPQVPAPLDSYYALHELFGLSVMQPMLRVVDEEALRQTARGAEYEDSFTDYICIAGKCDSVPGANAQISVGGSTAALPTPQGITGTTWPNVNGAGSSVSAGNYGPGNLGPGAVGPATSARARMVPAALAQAPILAGARSGCHNRHTAHTLR